MLPFYQLFILEDLDDENLEIINDEDEEGDSDKAGKDAEDAERRRVELQFDVNREKHINNVEGGFREK